MNAYKEIVLEDVFFHLEKLKGDFARYKIENNKNQLMVYAMNDFTNRVQLIEQIVKSYDNNNLKSLTNKINTVLLKDPELHRINVILKKRKCLPQIDNSKSALIIQLI